MGKLEKTLAILIFVLAVALLITNIALCLTGCEADWATVFLLNIFSIISWTAYAVIDYVYAKVLADEM